jgi:hypothetical protein
MVLLLNIYTCFSLFGVSSLTYSKNYSGFPSEYDECQDGFISGYKLFLWIIIICGAVYILELLGNFCECGFILSLRIVTVE